MVFHDLLYGVSGRLAPERKRVLMRADTLGPRHFYEFKKIFVLTSQLKRKLKL